MTAKFVNLNRLFTPIPILDNDERDLSDYYSVGMSKGVVWDKLLDIQRVIILAEAGSGKTAEIENKSSELRKRGEYSFFLRLEDLKDNFEFAFVVGDIDLFNEWQSGNHKAYFFLDSVDEAKISSERDFQKALRCFENRIHAVKNRTNIYITSRGSAWRGHTDLNIVNNLLGSKNENTNTILLSFEVYSFTELSIEQIRVFSDIYGVQNINEFIKQLQSNEAEIFAKRPLDLLDLISFWKINNRIGSRLELIKSSIDNKIENVELGRDPCVLALLKLKEGAKSVAAALTFCKSSRVSIPDSAKINNALRVQEILNDWTVDEITTLLNRPIFEQCIYGTSRFSHRMIREYLTALWISDRVKSGKIKQDEVHDIFYSKIYDVEVPVLAFKPILCWYVLLDEAFAKTVIDLSPEVLIEGGDSSKIPINQRIELLSKFCEMYGDKEKYFITFDSTAIDRFSSPEMGETINSLLVKYYLNKELRQTLLQIALSSKMSECLDVALKISIDNNMDYLSKTLSLRLINKVTNYEYQFKHAKVVLKSAPKENEKILSVIINEVGDKLPLINVLDALSIIKASSKLKLRYINSSIERFFEGLNYNQSIEAINYLYELINAGPYIERRNCDISVNHEWLFDGVLILLTNVLLNKDETALTIKIIDLLTKANSYQLYRSHDDKGSNKKLAEIVVGWKALNTKLFWHDVEVSRRELLAEAEKHGDERPLNRWFQAGWYKSFWVFNYDYLDTVLEWVSTKELIDDKFVALSLALEIAKDGGHKQEDEEKLDFVAKSLDGGDLLLYAYRNPEKPAWQLKDEKRKEEYQKKEIEKERVEKENLKESISFITNNMHLIDDMQYADEGNTTNVQMYLYNKLSRLKEDRNCYILDDCSPLTSIFGEEISNKFQDFCINYWKEYKDNILVSEGGEQNSTKYATIIALCGISIEDKLNPDWIDNISSENACNATKLAFCELNTVPEWLRKVYEKFPDEVLSVFVNDIEWSYRNNDDSGGILGKVIHNCDYLYDGISQFIIGILERNTTNQFNLLEKSIRILCSSKSVTNDQLEHLACTKIEENLEPSLSYIWWALLIGVNADTSLHLFERKLGSMTTENATILAMNVLTSIFDRRDSTLIVDRASYRKVYHLVTMYKVMYMYIKEEDDIDRTGGVCYTPTIRDNAQDARNGLLSIIKGIPGEESYNALRNIADSKKNKPWVKSWIDHMALERATQDGDLVGMSEKEFTQYSSNIDKIDNSKVEIKIEGTVENSIIGNNVNHASINKTIENDSRVDSIPTIWHERALGKVIIGVITGVVLLGVGWLYTSIK
ncbi:NACHT domain-containing protein [Aliivibrio logei]|uniref:ATP-binding protein n=1 Tax=Aliivibrio logei 5S-186 TaxID=626086 RepID=A0ABX3AYA8_ALILO|nr:hypothetical protein [Aliivibrio logei]OEF16993.1 hypothetical protein A1Q5_18845 [Aliivibrio logei 5S-186]